MMSGEVTRCSGLWSGGCGTVLLVVAWNVGSPWLALLAWAMLFLGGCAVGVGSEKSK